MFVADVKCSRQFEDHNAVVVYSRRASFKQYGLLQKTVVYKACRTIRGH